MTDYNLVERTCKGGCGRKFKVLPASEEWYARKDCQHVCFGVPLTLKETRKKMVATMYAGQKGRAKHFVDDELAVLCDSLIGHAKKLKQTDDGAKLDIAYLAVEAKRLCGATYPDFAKRANVKGNDLYGWISVYDRIAKVISSDTLRTFRLDFLVKVAKDMRDDMTKSEVLHLLQVRLNENEVVNLVEYKGQLEDMKTYFMGKNLDHLNKKELTSINGLLKDLTKKFRFWANGRA